MLSGRRRHSVSEPAGGPPWTRRLTPMRSSAGRLTSTPTPSSLPLPYRFWGRDISSGPSTRLPISPILPTGSHRALPTQPFAPLTTHFDLVRTTAFRAHPRTMRSVLIVSLVALASAAPAPTPIDGHDLQARASCTRNQALYCADFCASYEYSYRWCATSGSIVHCGCGPGPPGGSGGGSSAGGTWRRSTQTGVAREA